MISHCRHPRRTRAVQDSPAAHKRVTAPLVSTASCREREERGESSTGMWSCRDPARLTRSSRASSSLREQDKNKAIPP